MCIEVVPPKGRFFILPLVPADNRYGEVCQAVGGRRLRPLCGFRDRACLALGLTLKAPVYTTDRAWKSLKLGVRIHVIR